MRWFARLAARRVVWIIVGLAVYGLLHAAGVRAASSWTLAFPGSDVVTSSGHANLVVAGPFDVAADEQVRVVFGSLSGGTSLVGVYCGGDVVWSAPVSDVVVLVPGSAYTGCGVVVVADGNVYDAGMTGDGAAYVEAVGSEPGPTPTSTPTPPPDATPTPTATPAEAIHVIVDDPGDQFRTAFGVQVFGFMVSIFLAAVTAVAVSFRLR